MYYNFYRFSPDAKTAAPRWACALCALGLFVYQSLDAIDGKQARRTGSSNPLGELFDHGCDSVSTVFVALSACTAVQLGHYPGWMFFQVIKNTIFESVSSYFNFITVVDDFIKFPTNTLFQTEIFIKSFCFWNVFSYVLQ